MTIDAAVLEHDLIAITRSAWTGLHGGELAPGSGSAIDTGLQARVGVTGAWSGEVVIRCSRRACDGLAAAAFGRDQSELSDTDRVDAVGELVNVVAGNLRDRLPRGSRLDLPVVEAVDPDRPDPGQGTGERIARATFLAGGTAALEALITEHH